MTPREGWAALGELIAAGLANAADTVATRFAQQIELRLQYIELDAATKKALKRALQKPVDPYELLLTYPGESLELEAANALAGLWEVLTDDEDFEPEQAWTRFADGLRERLADAAREVHEFLEGSRGFEAELSQHETDVRSIWPLEAAGDLRERVQAWVEAAVARGLDRRDLIEPGSLESAMTYRMTGRATAVSNLRWWLTHREAYARALAPIVPLLERFAPA